MYPAADPRDNDPDYTDEINRRLRELSYADLREQCDTYRDHCMRSSGRPFGLRFGKWLRERIVAQIVQDSYAAGDP